MSSQVPKLPDIKLDLKGNIIPNESMNTATLAKKLQEKASAFKNKTKGAKEAVSKSKMMKGVFDFLKMINDWLEKYPIRIIDAFDNIVGDGQRLLQEKVDKICEWLAWKVNIAIERKRQDILRTLYEQYQYTIVGKVMAVAGTIKKFVQNPLKAIGDFASAIFGPIIEVFKWIIDLAKEILRLAENLAKIIRALPPTPPNPQINYDKFKLKIRSISLAEVTTDPSAWPTPEELFPEPPKPFSKEAFQAMLETASYKLKSAMGVYKLNPEDKATLAKFEVRTDLSSLVSDAVTPSGDEPVVSYGTSDMDDLFS